uniref:AF-4_C domain-containing protein n=1 Tax=Angiostrongylus cantonensis TaxID=6313 RepID=A0A0K0DG17_ANGCA
MPEDPDLSKRRIEHQQLRKQLNEVFGPFEQFCEYVAGTASAGSSGIMRHGVVQSMQNLVASPIRPIQGLSFSFNQDCHTSEASSTHSAPEASSNLVKGKRHRMQDSDTEVERDKRKRRDEDVMLYAFPIQLPGIPGTSRSNTRTLSTSDGHRTAFRDGAERKELMDKGISPDSGVHSAENDPGDDNDIHSAQTIINIITKLSPPLSPIKKPPSDKKAERERKEIEIKERQRKEHYEHEVREEEERERLEKEQAERDERLRSERLEYEEKERDREKLRRDREREEKDHRDRDQEDKKHKDKDRKEKERAYSIKREREVEQKPREQKEYEQQLRREKEREVRKQRVVEPSSGEKKSKESGRGDGHERDQKLKNGNGERMKLKESGGNLGDRVSRLDGEIILKGLDRSRLSQLIEIGRKMGRTKEERKDDRKEKTEGVVERRKEKKEREKWSNSKQDVEDSDVHRREKDSSASSPCMPHASISQSHDGSDQTHFRSSSTMGNHPSRIGFECAAAESAPTKPARPVKPKEDSTEMLYDFYQSVAKSQKRKGDVETDKVNKVLFYLDTAVYFILSARHVSSDSPENRGNRQYSIIRDTNDLLKIVQFSMVCSISVM